MQGTVLVWFRNDLRSHDHEPLYRAVESVVGTNNAIIPLYCFDPRQFSETAFGFAKTGVFRSQFLLESVIALRNNLRSLGSDLVIRMGFPEVVIPEIAQKFQAKTVYYHAEVTSEELAVEKSLCSKLRDMEIKAESFWGHTLYHPEDLPFERDRLPELFTNFRKQVEKTFSVRPPFPTPPILPQLPSIEVGDLPQLSELVSEDSDFGLQSEERGVLKFKGGETAGLTRLEHYFWQSDRLQIYKETRNGMLGADYSSKFSPWLALGCLSPRYIYAQIKKYEQERTANDSTYWLVFELLWRDYFRFVAEKHGDRLFHRSGLQELNIPWQQDWQRFDLWRNGKTGFPLIDANMRELALTGFMSNRGRQNVASFLTKNLGIDWRMGAEWFESLLIDYDPCSNWGNWNYTAGVGNDARGFRYFNILKQSKDYDPNGDYVKYWLPELAALPSSKVHEPWKLLPVEQKRFALNLGVDYPHPIVDLVKSAQANEQRYLS
jgi:deoxyribodipyrimidine photo-lyase